jgi:hypothetical protein
MRSVSLWQNTTNISFRTCKFHPAGRITFYNGLTMSNRRLTLWRYDISTTRLSCCYKPYATKCVAFERQGKCIAVVLHYNQKAQTVPVHMQLFTNCKNLKLHSTYNNFTQETATCSIAHFAAQQQKKKTTGRLTTFSEQSENEQHGRMNRS